MVLPAMSDDSKKGTAVSIDGLESRAPAAWLEEESTSKMRFKQFRLPAADKDKENGELIIFFFGPGGGGSVNDNVKRWKGFFVAPEGKSADDISKVDKFKVGDVEVTYLDIQGTYLYKAQPFNPNAQTTKKPDYRMLGVVFECKQGPYFMRVVGPAATVKHHKAGFDDWLKAFK